MHQYAISGNMIVTFFSLGLCNFLKGPDYLGMDTNVSIVKMLRCVSSQLEKPVKNQTIFPHK